MTNGRSQTQRGRIVVTQARISAHPTDGRQWPVEPLPASPEVKTPARRAGSSALWSQRRQSVRGTPPSTVGGTTHAAVGRKAINSGWEIVQNEANFRQARLAVTTVRMDTHEMTPASCLFENEANCCVVRGRTTYEKTPYGVTTNRSSVQNEPNLRETGIDVNHGGKRGYDMKAGLQVCENEANSLRVRRLRRGTPRHDRYNPPEKFSVWRAHLGRGDTHIYER
jgi:hypothetical protein